ncbi:MAG TPA: STAS domain-containing protein [Gammaproteobacteria bacterium]|jgi:phospholipid transport system transporter-binding protein|nr:STAS domain-containing protein [Gammaproteobacteria bacterium]
MKENMKKQATITLRDNICFLSGDLHYSNVMSVYADSQAVFLNRDNIQMDCTELRSSDSTGLALIIEWIKLTKAHHQKFTITGLPADILSLAKAAGLDGFLSRAYTPGCALRAYPGL